MNASIKKYLLSIVVILLVFNVEAKTPDWVKSKPSSLIYYTGVGVAQKSDKDYMKKAKAAALNDLISEIQVEVSSNSLLKKQEVNFNYSDSFVQEIRTKANADIEQFELVDTWSNSNEYWVYYQLDKQKYEGIMKLRIDTATKKGLDLWLKGLAQQQAGNIMGAAEAFCKGLETVSPYINKELTVTYQGTSYDLGNELYNSLNTVFNGIAISTSKSQIELNHFAKEGETVAVNVTAQGTPVQGVKINATFAPGSGSLQVLSTTDASGNAQLKISNITSKNQNQTIKISIDNAQLKALSNSYLKTVIDKTISRLPTTSISVVNTQAPLKAVLYGVYTYNEQLVDAVAKEIAHNYFDVTLDYNEADIKIVIEAEYKIGVKVKGELYNMVETFCSANVIITNIANNTVITAFGVDNIRSLSPESDSVQKSRNTANRELLKRLRPVFKQKMSEINITPRPKATIENIEVDDDENMPKYE